MNRCADRTERFRRDSRGRNEHPDGMLLLTSRSATESATVCPPPMPASRRLKRILTSPPRRKERPYRFCSLHRDEQGILGRFIIGHHLTVPAILECRVVESSAIDGARR